MFRGRNYRREAERVARRVDQHLPPLRARLRLRQKRSGGDGGSNGLGQLLDRELEVQLLRQISIGPTRGPVTVYTLSGQPDRGLALQCCEVIAREHHVAAHDPPVELHQRRRVVAVEGHGTQRRDHDAEPTLVTRLPDSRSRVARNGA